MHQYTHHHAYKSKLYAIDQCELVKKSKNQHGKEHTQFFQEFICQDTAQRYFF